MIPKVNRPELQLVVSQTKPAENDPGSSQGGSVAYEKPPDQEPKEEIAEEEESTPESRSEVPPSIRADQIGLGEVMRMHYESKRTASSPRAAGPQKPGRQYQDRQDHPSASKGLLLNKKAE